MPRDAVETLRQVNEYLRSALVRLRPERKRCSAITPQDFSDILNQLLQASECVGQRPEDSEGVAAMDKESVEYRGNLERLKHFLPDLHLRLLAEKCGWKVLARTLRPRAHGQRPARRPSNG
ncbi:MAG: hypothetical protein WBW85_02160 [Terriglobales bacterium]